MRSRRDEGEISDLEELVQEMKQAEPIRLVDRNILVPHQMRVLANEPSVPEISRFDREKCLRAFDSLRGIDDQSRPEENDFSLSLKNQLISGSAFKFDFD